MMTIEELSGMSDEELRVMCGRAHGYTLARESEVAHPENGTLLTRLLRPDGGVELQFWWGKDLDAAWKPSWKYMPNYPADLNAAMQLCEALADEGWNCEANMGLNKCWEVIFLRPTTERNERTRQKFDGSLWEEYYAPADTLAKAIVLAFIATKQSEHI